MPRLSVSEFGSSNPLELEHLEPRELLSGNPIVAQVREMTWETLSAATTNGYLYRSDTDGTWIVGAYQNGTVEVRSAATGAVERTLQTGVGRAYYITVENGIAYVSAGIREAGCVIAWDCTTGQEMWRRQIGTFVNNIGVRDGVIGVDVDYKGTMQIDAASGNVLAAGDPEGGNGTVVTKGIVVYARAGNQVWLDDNGSRRMLASGGGNITARIAVSPDGQFIAVGRSNGAVELRSVSDWNVVGTAGVNGSVSSIGWSVTGKTLLVGSASGEVSEWTVGEDGTLTEAGRTDTGRMVFAVDEVNGAVFAQAGDSAAVWRELPLWEARVAEVVAEEEPAVSAEAIDAVFAEMAAEEQAASVDMLASLSSYAAGLVLSARESVEEMNLVVRQKQEVVAQAQAAYDSAAAHQQAMKTAYLAADSTLGTATTARKDAESAYWITYATYKYSDAGKIAQAQAVWNTAIANEQNAQTKKTAASAAYVSAQEACTAAAQALVLAQEDLQAAQDRACAEDDACAAVEARAFAGELVAPTEHELWVAARQEEAQGKLTSYGYDQWNAVFAANGYETAPPIWKTGSISFGLSMQQLPESLFNTTGCAIDRDALALSIARGRDGWLYGDTLQASWEMIPAIAQRTGMREEYVRYMQQQGLNDANEQAGQLIGTFQEMVQDLFFVELGKRTGSAIPTVREVSHPLLPTRAAVEQCVQLVFGNMYANYQWMCQQSEEGHTISANGSDRAGTENEGKTPAQIRFEAQMNYLILSGQASTTGEAKEKATAYYTPSGTLTAGAAGTTVVAETEPDPENVITGVRLVATAGMSDSDPYFDGEVLHGAGSTLSGIEFGLKIQAALKEWTSKDILEKPTGDNTMILVIYGSNQFPSDSSGFDALTTQLQLEYPEAWAMSPGFNPFGGMVAYTNGLAPSDMQPDIQNLINTRLANNADLKNVVLIGYSWGGGMAYNISTWLDETHPEINLAASIYVDAVALGSMSAEVRLPVGTQSFLNIYQSKTGASEWFLNGTAIQPQTFVDIVQVDMDANADSETHTTIDEASVSAILEFIRQRIISLSSQS